VETIVGQESRLVIYVGIGAKVMFVLCSCKCNAQVVLKFRARI
jgi:hypothetical protein